MSPLNLARLGGLLAALLLAACGGGGSSDPAAPVARVEILSASAWLAGAGQTRELAAQAFDADGNPVDATITWTSSRPGQVAVAANGTLSAMVAAGSAQISAQAGGISSTPILAFVASPAPGVTVVADAAIVGGPVETAPDAAPSLANTYQVTLTGAAPAVGALLLGDGDTPLAGRVMAVEPLGAQTRVTLQLVPITDLFATLQIEEVFDLSRAEVLVPPEVAAEFNVARSGNTWSFTPRPQPAGSERQRPLNLIVPREIRPFGTCDATVFGPGDVRNLLIGVEQPSFSITVSPSLDLHYDRLSGLTRFIVSAEPLVTLGATLRVSMPLKGEVSCSLKLFQIRLPIGGPLAFFFGGTAPVGVGFKLEGEAAPTTFKVGGQTEIGTKLSLGWNCPGPDCEFVQSVEDLSATFTPVFDPLDPIQFARLSSKLHLFGSMDLEIGNPFLRALRFKGLEGKFGPALKGNFAPPVEQLRDAAYMSDYSLMMKGEVKLGLNIADILAQLGLTGRLRPSLLLLEYELASSPKALKIEADRATFGAGDTVNVKVRLDPATLTFLPGIDNVESVQLRRSVSGLTEVLATQTASPGQEVFDFSVSAPAAGNAEEWTAFVVSRLLNFELASLELGAVRGTPSEPELEPIPAGNYVLREGVPLSILLQSPSEAFPGQGECEVDQAGFSGVDPEVRGAIPFDWTRQSVCAFQEGTVTGRFEAVHGNGGSGRMAFASTGRFQTSTSHHASLRGSMGPRASESFRITAPGMSGQRGTAVGRFRVRVKGQIPANFLDCTICSAQATAVLQIAAAFSGDRVEERLNSGPNVDPGLLRSSVDVEHVLTIPLTFNYGVPFPVLVTGVVAMSISGYHRIAVDYGVSIAYEWLDFSGLPEGAVVESYGGPVGAPQTGGP